MIQAQSWQWGKSGGGGGSSPDVNDKEEVVSMVTDSQKNIYILSKLFDDGQQVAGQPVEFYDQPGDYDYIISSVACDGTYRWSKVIGGKGRENLANLAIDSNDNLYLAGRLSVDQVSPFYPRRIANDLILANNDYSILFLIKMNNLGVVQWIKRPLPSTTTESQLGSRFILQITIDSQGFIYCYSSFAPGIYCDGLFNATCPTYDNGRGAYYILKYDSNGNYINATYIDFKPKANQNFFARNHNTGQFFVYGDRVGEGSNYYPSFAGQLLQNSAYIACYGIDGQFLWKTENVDTSASGAKMQTQNLVFDEQNNIYVSARFVGTYVNNPLISSFLGHSVTTPTIPATIFKIDPTGQNLLWATSSLSQICNEYGGIEYRNGKLGLTNYCGGADYSWGNQTMTNVTNFNQGLKPLLARFNPATGECIGLANIPNDLSTYDLGRTLAIDASGDFIIGGSFGSQLFVGPNTLTATGASDFFIAKYSTTACSPLEVKNNEKPKNTLVAYPNPTNSIINICVNEACNFNIYSTTGAIVQKGIISREENTIDISKLAVGAYTIVVITPAGLVSEVKVLRE